MKTLVGAFVASAIEIRLAAAPVIAEAAAPVATYVLVSYLGEDKWISASAEKAWTAQYGKSLKELTHDRLTTAGADPHPPTPEMGVGLAPRPTGGIGV